MSASAPYLTGELPLVDAHLHLTSEALLAYPPDFAAFLRACGVGLGRAAGSAGCGDFSEADFSTAVAAGGGARVGSAVFVEVLPVEPSAVAEARWILGMVAAEDSCVQGLVAHIPVAAGEGAVRQWVNDFDASLAEGVSAEVAAQRRALARRRLSGCRLVLADQGPEAIRAAALLEGLRALPTLRLAGEPLPLHFEICLNAPQLGAALEAVRAAPETRFVLDHCGLNASGKDFDEWKAALAALAGCANVVGCKLSAVEEWDCIDGDAAPYLDHALRCFGPARCMYGGNWFVPEHPDFGSQGYGQTAKLVGAALDRMGATAAQAADVFANTATRVYRLDS